MSSAKRRDLREGTARRPEQSFEVPPTGPLRLFAVPLAFTLGLLALTLLPRIRATQPLLWSFWGAVAILLA